MQKLILLTLTCGIAACFNAHEIKHRPTTTDMINIIQASNSTPEKVQKSIYDFNLRSIDGEDISLSQFKGKKIIILNVASECGYTPQYADWERFYKANSDKAVVLGFPCNQFMGQEPGDNKAIKAFCEKNYGVTFPIFEKTDVKGDKKSPLYAWLTDKNQNGWNDKEPSWNFCKYLINEKGELVEFFASKITPDNPEFKATLAK